MKTRPTRLLLPLFAIVATALSPSAHAVLYGDFDFLNQYVTADATPNGEFKGEFSGEFNLIENGYNPSTQYLTDAVVNFVVYDDDFSDSAETVSINLGPNPFLTGSANFLFSLGDLGATALIDLSDDGILGYKIQSLGGDFIVAWAAIEANAETKPSSVPDGGMSITLLGLSLVGIGLAHRRLMPTA